MPSKARPAYVRVSGRGRWHIVAGKKPTGALVTACGRIVNIKRMKADGRAPESASVIPSVAPCDKCVEAESAA